MKGPDIDVELHCVEGPGGVGDNFRHVHQVEAEHAVEVFVRNGAPAEGDEGGSEGRPGGGHRRCRWNCVNRAQKGFYD